MLIPELQEFHKLFAQMDILQQKLIKFRSRDTLICDNVLGSGSPTPPGVELWKIKIRFYPAGHRKMIRQLVRSGRMNSYVDPRAAGIQYTVCANGHLAAKVDKILVPRPLICERV